MPADSAAIAVAFASLLPEHKAGLSLTHNEHKGSYETVEEWIGHQDTDESELTDEDRATCIATGEIWRLQWYPDTSVGFYSIIAPTLGRLIERLGEDQGEERV